MRLRNSGEIFLRFCPILASSSWLASTLGAVENATSMDSQKQNPQMLGKASHTPLGFPTFSTAPATTITKPASLSRNSSPKLWTDAVQRRGALQSAVQCVTDLAK